MGTRSVACQFVTWVTLAAAIIVLLPARSAAQEPVKSFDQLNTRFKIGDTVWVTDAAGREVKGKIVDLAPEAVTVKAEVPRTYGPADVSLIHERRPDSFKNGALIGLVIGGGLTLGLCMAASESEDYGWCALGAGIYGGAGAAIGVGIDALVPGKKLVAYRAPGTPGSSQARLSIAPVFAPRAKGVAVAFSF
jgi:hypothetical protein